jgi:hypothetical protein
MIQYQAMTGRHEAVPNLSLRAAHPFAAILTRLHFELVLKILTKEDRSSSPRWWKSIKGEMVEEHQRIERSRWVLDIAQWHV